MSFPAPHHLHPDSAAYWFLMRIGIIAEFFTSWPVNARLIRAGTKEAMEPAAALSGSR